MLEDVGHLDGNLTLSVGRCDLDDIPAVQRLFGLADDPKATDLLRWQYVDPPGGSYLAVAHDGRGPLEGGVATYAAMPLPFSIGGQTGTALQSFDTLTLAQYRGRGLFPALGRAVYDLATENGEWLVFGIPNEAIVRGRERHLSWRILGEVPMRLRPFGLRYVRSRLLRRHGDRFGAPDDQREDEASCSPELATVPDDIDALAGGFGQSSLGVYRSKTYLRWRLSRPHTRYITSTVRAVDGRLLAWGAATVGDKHGGRIGYLMDVMALPEEEKAAKKVTRELLGNLRQSGADVTLAWASPGTPLERILQGNRFLPLPPRTRPIKLFFGFRGLTKDLGEIGSNLGSWNLSYFDSDTV